MCIFLLGNSFLLGPESKPFRSLNGSNIFCCFNPLSDSLFHTRPFIRVYTDLLENDHGNFRVLQYHKLTCFPRNFPTPYTEYLGELPVNSSLLLMYIMIDPSYDPTPSHSTLESRLHYLGSCPYSSGVPRSLKIWSSFDG